jgi:hypothetical protein
MRKIGTCAKCGETKEVGQHHLKGYLGENINVTAPYCQSCDKKAHWKARKDGRCVLTGKETSRLSKLSYVHRNIKQRVIYKEVIDIFSYISINLSYNLHTNTICIVDNHKINDKEKYLNRLFLETLT